MFLWLNQGVYFNKGNTVKHPEPQALLKMALILFIIM